MFSKIHYIRRVILLLSHLWMAIAFSAPPNPQEFKIQQGGFVDLSHGAIVQGSVSHGGGQPDFVIDMNDPDLSAFLKQVRYAVWRSPMILFLKMIGQNEIVRTKTIEVVTALIRKALPERSGRSETYMRVLEEHRLAGLDISLGSYLRCAAGVCRENALLTHLALKAVGIQNHYVYIKVGYSHTFEDHAVVVIQDKNHERWIVDPYNMFFHGRNFDDLVNMESRGRPKNLEPRIASFADDTGRFSRIVSVLGYPTYWIPNQRSNRMECSAVF